MLRREAEAFFAALGFFSRLPVPAWAGCSAEQLQRAPRYFPLIGILVGIVGGAVTLAATTVLPSGVAVALGMAATAWATGALHEDGFADACDGFGGGWERAQVLAIMKDSRLGSFGAVGIVLMLLTKWNALAAFSAATLFLALVAGHAVSRLMAVVPMALLDYARADDATARSAPLAERPTRATLAVAAFFGLAPLLALPWPAAATGLAAALVCTLLAVRLFSRRIGGYTGDCLGATQQASELAFYLGVLCVLS